MRGQSHYSNRLQTNCSLLTTIARYFPTPSATRRIGKLVGAGDQDIRAAGGMVFNAPIKLLAGLSGWKDACTIRTTINSTHPTISPPPNANSVSTGATVLTDCCDIWLVFRNFPHPGLATSTQRGVAIAINETDDHPGQYEDPCRSTGESDDIWNAQFLVCCLSHEH